MWIEEPNNCIHCKDKDPMEFRQVCIDDKDVEGWICDNCGWFHFKDTAYIEKYVKLP